MRKKIIFLLSVSLVAIYFVACRKQMNPTWDVDVLTPLIKSTLNINNIIPDSILQHNSNNSLDIVYKSSLTSFSSNTLFVIPDTSMETTYVSFATTTILPGQPIFSTSNVVKYNLHGAQLSDVILRQGKMVLMITSSLKGSSDFTYSIPKMKDANNIPFSKTITVPAAISSTSPGIALDTFDLSGYNVDLTGPTGTSVNTMTTSYSAIVTPLPFGDTLPINFGDVVSIKNQFIGIVPEYAKGYFGHSFINVGPDSTPFSLFDHISSGTLSLEDMNIGLSIENNIGADARLTINNLSSINTKSNSTVALSANSVIGAPINITRAVDNFGVITPTTYSFSLTPSNSNIKAFFENMPDMLSYKLGVEVNPLGNVSGNNDFVYYDKLMKTELNMTIPLSIIANDLTLGDTVDLGLGKNSGNINSGTLLVYVENGFPFEAEAQLYLLDSDMDIVDSLISTPNTILSPDLDANHICIGKRESRLVIPVDADKMGRMRHTDKMYIQLKFNTQGKPSYVKLYSTYEMKVKVVGEFNYTVGK